MYIYAYIYQLFDLPQNLRFFLVLKKQEPKISDNKTIKVIFAKVTGHKLA